MMKSAYELAMERLQKGSPTMTLTPEQKAELAEIDSSFNAKIAERRIFLTDQITKAAAVGKFDDVESLQRLLVDGEAEAGEVVVEIDDAIIRCGLAVEDVPEELVADFDVDLREVLGDG